MSNCKLGFVATLGFLVFAAHAQKFESADVGLGGVLSPVHEVKAAESEEQKLLAGPSTRKSEINPLTPTLSGDALPPKVQNHVMESVNKQPKKTAAENK